MLSADPGSRSPRPRPHIRFPFQTSRRLTLGTCCSQPCC